jgi:hypothetical protein
LQVVASGVVKLPEDLRVDILGQYGALTVAMPAAALLSAANWCAVSRATSRMLHGGSRSRRWI